MAKRYGLESIIGKKSSMRFPRSVNHTKTDNLSSIIPANALVSEPPFSTAITMKKGDPLDTCDSLNELSYDYEENLPIKAKISISSSGSKVEISTPTIFSMINIIYDLDEVLVESLRPSLPNISLTISNLALAKINTSDNFFNSEIISNIKTIYGNLTSYNCGRRKDKRAFALTSPNIRQDYLLRKTPSISQKFNHKRDLHFFIKTKKVSKLEKLPILFEKIDTFFDMYDDWDDFHDDYLKDHALISSDLSNTYSQLSNQFVIIKQKISEKNYNPQILYLMNALKHNSNLIYSEDFDISYK